MRFAPFMALLSCACGPDIPATVYVPAPTYAQQLTIAVSLADGRTARAGVPVRLGASRSTGPWRAIPRDSANLEECWWSGPPPEREPEVTANIRWRAQPSDDVTFNLPTPPDLIRTITFAKPGAYTLWGESHGCPKQLFSDTLTIVVQ